MQIVGLRIQIEEACEHLAPGMVLPYLVNGLQAVDRIVFGACFTQAHDRAVVLRYVYDIPLSDTTALALRGLTPFVTTKGTLYAFFPSLSAIKQLAEPPAPVDGTNRPYACETGLARL